MKRKLLITFSSLLLLSALWFLCVDEVVFVDDCPDCGYQRLVFEIRIFTIPVHQRIKEHVSITQEIAMDIGAECKHPNMTGYLNWRIWGLLIPEEYHPGIGWLGGDDWYDDKARAIVKEMAKANPSLRDEFANRVLKNHDWNYLKAFVRKVSTLRDEKQASATAPSQKSNP